MNGVLTWLSTAIDEQRRWRPSQVCKPGGVRVFYGYESLASARDVAFGGLVKTQDLQRAFPNTVDNPNVLYLISSALPPYAPRMARLAKKAGAMVVLNQNGVAYPAWHGEGWETSNRFMREVLQQADHVFYQSQFCKLGADRYLGARQSGADVLYNPVDTTYFQPPAVVPPITPVRLLLAGSHTHYYRVQSAVDTLRVLRELGMDAVLEIAGRCCWPSPVSTAEAQLADYIRSQGLTGRVTCSGAYTQEQARSLFHRAHILLHTKYNDPCPRLVVEAMASGLPVVYSASGGTPELVGNDAGVGVPAPLDWEADHPPAANDLAAAVQSIMTSLRQYSTAARRRAVAMFDVKPWIERHRRVFASAVRGAMKDGR